ncbi:alanine racemase [Enterovirga aerilata]|uniref:alanine racemase n=1 Tax=Enterovirga aerilata TaxID=2730920 RepID=A0A849HZY4_9HYPH|nr:alanine racemase [Enterovirga sp. DB1703]
MSIAPGETSLRPTWLEIDPGAFRHNLERLRDAVGRQVAIYACLKRNAYGCGAGPIARAAVAGGADGLAVGNIDDAISIRRAGVTAPVMLYPTCLPEVATAVAEFDLTPTVSTPAEVESWATAFDGRRPVFAKFDVGLMRGGAQPSEFGALLARIAANPKLSLAGIYTHFHTYGGPEGAGYLEWQVARLREAVAAAQESGADIPFVMGSNSALVVQRPDLDLSGVDPGRLLYGVTPAGPLERKLQLRPALAAFRSRILFAKTITSVPDDERLSPFPARIGMRIGVLPVGWGDGLPRRFRDGARALVQGRPVPILNPVHLEHLRLDLSAHPEAVPGDEVTLIGRQGTDAITLEEVEAAWGLDGLSLLAGLRDHLRRDYGGAEAT